MAEDYYDLYVTQLIFRKLKEGIAVIKKENEVKMKKAELYHNRYDSPTNRIFFKLPTVNLIELMSRFLFLIFSDLS